MMTMARHHFILVLRLCLLIRRPHQFLPLPLPLPFPLHLLSLQIIYLPQHSRAIESQILVWNGHEAYKTACWGNAEGVGKEGLEEGGVAFVGGGLEEGGEGGNGEDVGGVEGAAEEHAGRVAEGEEDGGGGALVALGELLGEVLEEGVFVVDLVEGGGRVSFVGFGVKGGTGTGMGEGELL